MSSEVHIWSQVKHTDAKTQTRFMLKTGNSGARLCCGICYF